MIQTHKKLSELLSRHADSWVIRSSVVTSWISAGNIRRYGFNLNRAPRRERITKFKLYAGEENYLNNSAKQSERGVMDFIASTKNI